jgi:xylulose-5-phosphate/fructose-6-phosphate phosphoketolase
MGRSSDQELVSLFTGLGYTPYFVEGDDPEIVHQLFAGALDRCYARIREIQKDSRTKDGQPKPDFARQSWPMIILRTPKGWTCPKEVDGIPIEGTFRAHQVPLSTVCENPEHLKMLEAWMRKYRPDELFDEEGRLIAELAALAPDRNLRMGASPHVNGGRLLKALDLPDFANYALSIPGPGQVVAEAPRKLG